jgi:tRNA(fMet)-specific endonuclease VapC
LSRPTNGPSRSCDVLAQSTKTSSARRVPQLPSFVIPSRDVMASFLLDTDTVSFALRGHGGVAHEIARRRPSELCVSAITLAELRFGAHRRRSRKIHAAIDAFVSAVQVAPFDDAAAEKFGAIGAALADAGVPIGQMDTLIAAHALSLGAILVTNNTKHFSKVAGLSLENWC